jgi:hypothetical protein
MYHPKHVEQFPDINKLCNLASCWIYEYIGIQLGARPILHISRIKVNVGFQLWSVQRKIVPVNFTKVYVGVQAWLHSFITLAGGGD